jgi:hypothetical protein
MRLWLDRCAIAPASHHREYAGQQKETWLPAQPANGLAPEKRKEVGCHKIRSERSPDVRDLMGRVLSGETMIPTKSHS